MGYARMPGAVTLSVALVLALPATANAARVDRYVERLAHNAIQAEAERGCVMLRTVGLCGWRVRLVTQTEMLDTDVADCERWGQVCSYELAGTAANEPFFCTGTVAYYPRRNRWIADGALDCYGDSDPSWGQSEDGVLFREP